MWCCHQGMVVPAQEGNMFIHKGLVLAALTTTSTGWDSTQIIRRPHHLVLSQIYSPKATEEAISVLPRPLHGKALLESWIATHTCMETRSTAQMSWKKLYFRCSSEAFASESLAWKPAKTSQNCRNGALWEYGWELLWPISLECNLQLAYEMYQKWRLWEATKWDSM